MVIGDVNGFGTEGVALMGAGHVDDAVGDAEGELSLAVHQGGDGEVGQCEKCPALADIASVQVTGRHRHDGNGMAFVDFRYPAACICCEAVCTVQ